MNHTKKQNKTEEITAFVFFTFFICSLQFYWRCLSNSMRRAFGLYAPSLLVFPSFLSCCLSVLKSLKQRDIIHLKGLLNPNYFLAHFWTPCLFISYKMNFTWMLSSFKDSQWYIFKEQQRKKSKRNVIHRTDAMRQARWLPGLNKD